TIHANNTEDLMVRLENMLIEANPNLPLQSVGRMIVAGLNLAVQIVKFHDNVRRITEITEIYGYDRETNKILLRPLFVFDPENINQFTVKHGPSERTKFLIVEYLMKTGRYHKNWDKISSDDEIKRIFRALFRRNFKIYFRNFHMIGNNGVEKEKIFMKCFHYMITEIYGSDKTLSIDLYKKGKTVTVEIPYHELVDNRLIRRIYQISRLTLANRLKLKGKINDFVVKGNIAEFILWQDVFPVESEKMDKSEYVAEGFSSEDIISSFEKALAESFESLKNDVSINKLDNIDSFLRSERVKPMLPYLRLAIDHEQEGRGQVTYKDVLETKDL
ncbi:hypothetical protein KAJ27_19730, partial [bacterium]|nr:hypothetical protein [bacterium]